MKKLLARKKNNKGFSLVELIVVILIMAIIAVALAPQVMKWVGKSSENTDINNEATIKSTTQVAVADCIAEGKTFKKANTYTYYVLKGGVSTSSGSCTKSTDDVEEALRQKIQSNLGEYPAVKSNSKNVFKIEAKVDATDATSVTVTVTHSTAGTYDSEFSVTP